VDTFYIGKTEVTWGEWKSVRRWAAANGYPDLDGVGEGAGENFPVRSISWYDVVKWCNARSEREGKTPVYKSGAAVYRTGVASEPVVVSWANGYRLPSDSEWEFAARGGTQSQGYQYSGSNTMDAVGWYVSNSNGYPQEVGTRQANELGVHDMSGNVWEWCGSWSPGEEGLNRVIRGGAWNLAANECSVASRGHFIPGDRNFGYIGFRVATSGEYALGITVQPSVSLDGTTLSVEASGAGTLTYQWRLNGVAIAGGTSSQLSTQGLRSGTYTVLVSNGFASVTSAGIGYIPPSSGNLYVSKGGDDSTGDGSEARPYLTISKAIEAASPGQSILVGAGTYSERIEYAGKTLRIKSSGGPEATTIQGSLGNTVVSIDALATNSELIGFKITGGSGKPSPSGYGSDYYGGGVHCLTTALIENCIFEGNGKGIPRQNSATFGGAIYSAGGNLRVVNCLIINNYAWASGGASLTENGGIEFDRCTVHGNDSSLFFGRQGGLAVANSGKMVVRNSIVWGNSGAQLGAFGSPYNRNTEITAEYSDIEPPNDGGGAQSFTAGSGNTTEDPKFVDTAAKNYALQTGSPAIDSAAPGLPKDADGTPADMGYRLVTLNASKAVLRFIRDSDVLKISGSTQLGQEVTIEAVVMLDASSETLKGLYSEDWAEQGSPAQKQLLISSGEIGGFAAPNSNWLGELSPLSLKFL
jgi:hypothetical protein